MAEQFHEFYRWKDKVEEILINTVQISIDDTDLPYYTFFLMNMKEIEAAQAIANSSIGKGAPELQYEDEY